LKVKLSSGLQIALHLVGKAPHTMLPDRLKQDSVQHGRIVNLQAVRGQLAAHELTSQADVNLDLDEILAELGISEHTAQAYGPLVVTNGFFKSGQFEYDPWGQAVLAFIVYGADGETPIDVAAVAMANPARFGTRKGQAGLLGESFLRSCGCEPCTLFRNPLEWLQNDGRGACILNAILGAPIISSFAGDLAAADIEHGRWLVQSGAVPVQRLLVPADRRAA
jgi:hypothetical protein